MTHHFVPSESTLISPGVHATPITGLYYVPHTRFDDSRGFYSELSRIPELEEVLQRQFMIKQMNLSYSEQHVIRGIHAEDWDKLLTIIEGVCFCAWADLRPESTTFGDVVTMQVGKEAGALFGSVFVSAGIGNSFCVIKGPAHYLYAVNALYKDRDQSKDVAINLFDPDLHIEWPISREEMILSDRDLNAISMQTAFSTQTMKGTQ